MPNHTSGQPGPNATPKQVASGDPTERRADLRRRRADVIDVLVETLFDRLTEVPLGQRRTPAPPPEGVEP